jgi:hypothetical protein
MNTTISFFFKGEDEYNNIFIGCLTVSLLSLLHETYLATDYESGSESSQLNFLWRPPLVEPDKDKKWAQQDIIGASSYILKEALKNKTDPKDVYDRILGPEESKSQYINNAEVNYASAHILPDGTYVLLYDAPQGVKALFSKDSGRQWAGSDVVLARMGTASTMIDRYLFYVTASGIEMKQTQWTDYYDLRELSFKKLAGESTSDLEGVLQTRFDSEKHYLIGSGAIPAQKISGYITNEGIMKLFYYNSNNLLTCLETKDIYKWTYADNF